jgi:hypothetical protein
MGASVPVESYSALISSGIEMSLFYLISSRTSLTVDREIR